MSIISCEQLNSLYTHTKTIYESVDDLPFHGWHHINFVYKKAKIFAQDLNADINLTQSAALLHDLNYIKTPQKWSPPSEGISLRQDALTACGYLNNIQNDIENIIISADISTRRNSNLSKEAMALSDADTLFKALPIVTPIFTSRFMDQTQYSMRKLCDKILSEQRPLIEDGIYFYSDLANSQYLDWAQQNIRLWENIQNCLYDNDIIDMLNQINVNAD